jgi:hypothetical protein
MPGWVSLVPAHLSPQCKFVNTLQQDDDDDDDTTTTTNNNNKNVLRFKPTDT